MCDLKIYYPRFISDTDILEAVRRSDLITSSKFECGRSSHPISGGTVVAPGSVAHLAKRDTKPAALKLPMAAITLTTIWNRSFYYTIPDRQFAGKV